MAGFLHRRGLLSESSEKPGKNSGSRRIEDPRKTSESGLHLRTSLMRTLTDGMRALNESMDAGEQGGELGVPKSD